ncbi:MAG TPA: murein biosynthesis integral membrane protein MurJ [Streptosporangiaceae bacterium]|nr:murein biosynthesis integral membrane protein MurJ [Streptosporangiaceae bacterium]
MTTEPSAAEPLPANGRPAPPPQDDDGGDGGGTAGSSLLRSGAIMALGTVVSRVTGFLRTAVLVMALGTVALGDAYNVANTVPNIVYDLMLGGILTSVVVPLIVQSRERDRRYGEEYEQRLFTGAVIFLALLTIVAVLLAPVFISLYGNGFQGEQRELAILFARFFLPQIFFYGVGAFAGAILNARGRFGAPMWAPVLNNVVVIGIGVVFLLISTGKVDPGTITDGQTRLLAIGTTGGIVLQTLALWPSLRAAGFRWRPRLDFQSGEIGTIVRMAGWTLVYVLATQTAFAVVTALSTEAGNRGIKEGIAYGVGYTPYFNAYQLFQLPYAIVGVSVITALLPRMSEHAAEERRDLVRSDFSSGLRLSSVIIIPAAVLMFVLGDEVTTVLFAHGNTSQADALMIADVLRAMAVALVPYSAYQLMLRVFYAYRDTRTPAFIAMITVTTNIALAFVMFAVLPTERIVVGIALGVAIANAVGALVSWGVLRWRLGGLDGRRIVISYLKLGGAMVPGLIFAFAVHEIIATYVGTSFGPAMISLVIATFGGTLCYLVAARLLRAQEVQTMLSTVAGRLPGR